MSAGLGVVVLAGEHSEAMVSDVPPSLHRLAGTPAAQYVIDAARRLDPATVVVVGDEQGQGREALTGADAFLAGPRELFGSLGECEATLFVWGDTPLLDPSAMHAVVKRREETRARRAFTRSRIHGPASGPGSGFPRHFTRWRTESPAMGTQLSSSKPPTGFASISAISTCTQPSSSTSAFT